MKKYKIGFSISFVAMIALIGSVSFVYAQMEAQPATTKVAIITETSKVGFTPISTKGTITATIGGQIVATTNTDGINASIVPISGAYPLGAVITWTNSIDAQSITTIFDGAGAYDGIGDYVTFPVSASTATATTTASTQIFVTTLTAVGADGQPIFGYTGKTNTASVAPITNAPATTTTATRATDLQALINTTDPATTSVARTNSSTSVTFDFTFSETPTQIQCAVFPLSSNTDLSNNVEIMNFIKGLQAYKFDNLPAIPGGLIASCPATQTFTSLTDGKYLFVLAPNSNVSNNKGFEYFAWQVGAQGVNTCYSNARQPLADSASLVTKVAYFITNLFTSKKATQVPCGTEIFTMSYQMAINRLASRIDRDMFAVSQKNSGGRMQSTAIDQLTQARTLIDTARNSYNNLPTVQGKGDPSEGAKIRSTLKDVQVILDKVEADLY